MKGKIEPKKTAKRVVKKTVKVKLSEEWIKSLLISFNRLKNEFAYSK